MWSGVRLKRVIMYGRACLTPPRGPRSDQYPAEVLRGHATHHRLRAQLWGAGGVPQRIAGVLRPSDSVIPGVNGHWCVYSSQQYGAAHLDRGCCDGTPCGYGVVCSRRPAGTVPASICVQTVVRAQILHAQNRSRVYAPWPLGAVLHQIRSWRKAIRGKNL